MAITSSQVTDLIDAILTLARSINQSASAQNAAMTTSVAAQSASQSVFQSSVSVPGAAQNAEKPALASGATEIAKILAPSISALTSEASGIINNDFVAESNARSSQRRDVAVSVASERQAVKEGGTFDIQARKNERQRLLEIAEREGRAGRSFTKFDSEKHRDAIRRQEMLISENKKAADKMAGLLTEQMEGQEERFGKPRRKIKQNRAQHEVGGHSYTGLDFAK